MISWQNNIPIISLVNYLLIYDKWEITRWIGGLVLGSFEKSSNDNTQDFSLSLHYHHRRQLRLNCVTRVFVTNTIRRHYVSVEDVYCICYAVYGSNILSNIVDNRLFCIRHTYIQRQISVNSLILYRYMRVMDHGTHYSISIRVS